MKDTMSVVYTKSELESAVSDALLDLRTHGSEKGDAEIFELADFVIRTLRSDVGSAFTPKIPSSATLEELQQAFGYSERQLLMLARNKCSESDVSYAP